MLYDSSKGEITIALTGDFMLTRRLSVFKEERFLKLRQILRQADVGFANFESTAREYDEGSPTRGKLFCVTTEPKLLDDVKWLGINLVSCANNPASHFGEEGVLANIRHLDLSGISHSGTGRNMAEARSPAYLDTPAGRVALLSTVCKFNESERAVEQRPDFRGKPGVNPLGYRTSYIVDRQAMSELRRIGSSLGLEADKERHRKFDIDPSSEINIDGNEEYNLFGKRFLLGEGFAIRTKAKEKDAHENLRYLREARRQADWVIVSIHCHEEAGGQTFLTAKSRSEIEEWSSFARDFAHRCIDEGADIVVGHGLHILLGIEIYKGKPIFHGLGNFIFQGETLRFLPAFAYAQYGLDHNATIADFLDVVSDGDRKSHPADPLYWESVCAVCKFTSQKLAQVLLYPLDLGYGTPRAQRGRPLLADPVTGEKIITRLTRLSKELGTKIDYRDGVGIIMQN